MVEPGAHQTMGARARARVGRRAEGGEGRGGRERWGWRLVKGGAGVSGLGLGLGGWGYWRGENAYVPARVWGSLAQMWLRGRREVERTGRMAMRAWAERSGKERMRRMI